ncbi:MAG: anti-sigma factor domain-containing protein [Geminicoccaceae bacterium]
MGGQCGLGYGPVGPAPGLAGRAGAGSRIVAPASRRASPVSLGVLEQQGNNRRLLASPVQALLAPGANLAVSLEPVGGSPTGQPTGPVISSGVLLTQPF